MDAGIITPGKIDDRPIQQLSVRDLRGYDCVHFFAGIAGWEFALQLANYRGPFPVWTGSCPCQPFSLLSKEDQPFDADNHLWPSWFSLINRARPAIIFGEQVNNAIEWGWLDLVCDDLGGAGYSYGSSVLPACSVGAFHIRYRLYFMGYTNGARLERQSGDGYGWAQSRRNRTNETGSITTASDAAKPWRAVDWLASKDGKRRPTKPGLFPLAYGVSQRVGKLRAIGNAIVPQLGAEFIKASIEAMYDDVGQHQKRAKKA